MAEVVRPRVERRADADAQQLPALGRLLPTVRSLVSIPAGLLQMPFGSFVLFSALGTVGWTALLAIAGFKLRERFAEVDKWLGPVSNTILAALVLGYLWRLLTFKASDPR